MLAAIRASVPEVARGISTSLALLSAAPRCAPCSPTLNCPEAQRCPDCVCQGPTRVCPTLECPSVVHWVVIAVCLAFAVGLYVGAKLTCVTAVQGSPVSSPSLSDSELAAEARAQVARVRQRNAGAR